VNQLATNIVLWTSAITGLLSILWQLKRVISRISDFFDFVKTLEPELTEMKDSVIATNEILTDHVQNHPEGRSG
jgi:hypothetical protein